MPPTGVRTDTGPHDPAFLTAAGMPAPLMRGGEPRHLPGAREGCSATSPMRKHPAIAAGIVSPPPGHGRQRRLRRAGKRRRPRLRAPAKGKQSHLQGSARHRQGPPRGSPKSRQPRLRALGNRRQCRLPGPAASLRPVLAGQARSREGHLLAFLAATGEPMRRKPRASAGRPAARAVQEHLLPLPPRVGEVLLRERPPLGASRAPNDSRAAGRIFPDPPRNRTE
jgi:hypothetical protein